MRPLFTFEIAVAFDRNSCWVQMRFSSGSLAVAVSGFRRILVAVLIMSAVVNLLALTGSFYMLQIYDRVLTSHSVETLVALSILAIGLYLCQGVLDVIRGQILIRMGTKLDKRLIPVAHNAAIRLPLFGASTTDAVQPIRDVEIMRGFLSGQGPIAILDLPWMPIYLVFVYALHPILGLVALGGVVVLVLLTLLTEVLTSGLSQKAVRAGMARMAIADGNARNADVLRAMGFGGRAQHRFEVANTTFLDLQARTSDISGGLSGISKIFRIVLQSAVLGLGAYLTLQGEVTAGAIIAASIATSRAVAPIELAIANWKGFIAARQAYQRLKKTLGALPDEGDPLQLPVPSRSLAVDGISVPVPGTKTMVLTGVSFELSPGEALGVIGPSGAGKSTLARVLTGVWPLARGAVRIDGAARDRWAAEDLGQYVGYLPQDMELFDGTITQNIARFEEQPDSRMVIAAANAANVHEMILRLADGYETQLGPRGASLSSGQRQRIALARALYRDPFLVVLDEPNSNLDADGEAALTKAILDVRRRNGIVVVIAHRPSALQAVDKVAFISDGQLAAFGPKDEVLSKVLRRPA